MKKHLIAAAVAGAFAVPAMAQVTLSGTLIYDPLNLQKVETQAAAAAATTVKDNDTGFIGARSWTASQLQFSGTEDLGGGLRASFVTTLDLRNEGAAGSAHFNRDQNLAFSGGLGTVRLGRFIPASAMAWHGFSGAASTAVGAFYTVGTGSAGNTQNAALAGGSFERNSNQIQYTTPTMSGFTINANIGQNKDTNSGLLGKAETKQQGLSIGYAQGPLSVGIGANQREVYTVGTATVNGTSEESDLNWVGASYDFGVARVSATQVRRDGSTVSAASVKTKANDMTVNGIGVSVPMGAMTFAVSVYNGEDKATVAADDNLDLSGYQASVRYLLSKRTSVYALLGQQKITRAGGNTAGTNRTTSGNMVGLMHTF